MNTFEMMTEAIQTGRTYIKDDMRYSDEKGFHNSAGDPWPAGRFNSVNEIMSLSGWRPLQFSKTKRMTLKEIEEKLGHGVELISG